MAKGFVNTKNKICLKFIINILKHYKTSTIINGCILYIAYKYLINAD